MADFNSYDIKLVPDGADLILIQDVAGGNSQKRITITSLLLTALPVGDTASVHLDSGTGTLLATVLPAGVDHNTLANLNVSDLKHLTAVEYTDLTDAGDSTLHYHATDRDRANHTGTQLATTISDFAEAAQDGVGAILTNTATVEFAYDDVAGTIKAILNSTLKSNYDAAYTHVSNTSNPHSVTKAQVGLTNVTNDKQVRAMAGASVAGYIPTWDGVGGDFLAGGYEVETVTVTGSASKLCRSDAIKAYVDSVAIGLVPHTECVCATTAPGALASDFEGGVDTVDTHALVIGERILIKNQGEAPISDASQNGIYEITAGAPTRVADMPTDPGTFGGDFVFITGGTANLNTGWVVSSSGTVDVDDMGWSQFSAAETYTASNIGTAGVGVFKSKVGSDFQFKKINAGSVKITITDDVGNNEVDIDLVEAQITHDFLGGLDAADYHHLTAVEYAKLSPVLTASRLMASTAGGAIGSVANLASWVAGTATKLTVADDGDGTITLNIPASGAGGIVGLTDQSNSWGDFDQIFNTDGLVVKQTTKYVGVGTTAPASIFEIRNGLTTVGAVLTFGTKEKHIVANDILGRINFYAPLEESLGDANLIGASIAAIAEATFDASTNKTGLQFSTGTSETATEKMRLTYQGRLGLGITTPVNKLHIDSGTGTASYIQFTVGATTGQTVNDGAYIGVTSAGEIYIDQKESSAITNLVRSPSLAYTTLKGIVNEGIFGIQELNPTSYLHVGGSYAGKVTATAITPITLDETYHTLFYTAVGEDITLPAANTCPGRIYTIKQSNASDRIHIHPNGADTIDEIATYISIPAGEKSCYIIQSDGVSNWMILSVYIPVP